VLAYLIAIALLFSLLDAGGVWNVLANTRALDLLIRVGVVALTDADAGWVLGVPDLEHYVASQDPIDWGMLALAGLVFCGFWAVKSWQFHQLARFSGVPGDAGEHSRAYLYGLGVNRVLPFDLGEAATADALVEAGAKREDAARAVFLAHVMIVVEVVIFATLAVFLLGLSDWLAMSFWAVVILVAAWFLARPGRAGPGRGAYRRAVTRALTLLTTRPSLGLRVLALSLVAFMLEDIAAYVITQAFTSENVILHVDNKVLIMALVAGYVARLIAVTPGGIGQFEWAFAAALYLGGIGLPEAITIAILDSVVRYVTGTFVQLAMTLRYRSRTSMRRVLGMSGGNGTLTGAER
jgi:uncharacterized membrane protein YbhN (UPF0104 family)